MTLNILIWCYFWGALNFWIDIRQQRASITAFLLCIFWPLTVPAAFIASRFSR